MMKKSLSQIILCRHNGRIKTREWTKSEIPLTLTMKISKQQQKKIILWWKKNLHLIKRENYVNKNIFSHVPSEWSENHTWHEGIKMKSFVKLFFSPFFSLISRPSNISQHNMKEFIDVEWWKKKKRENNYFAENANYVTYFSSFFPIISSSLLRSYRITCKRR